VRCQPRCREAGPDVSFLATRGFLWWELPALPADEERIDMDEDGIGPGPGEGGAPVADGDARHLIHPEFADAPPEQQPRSHRAGMLAGLAVVGLLLAVLVAFAPGGSKPRLPAQAVHDVGPAPSGPKTAAAAAPPAPSTSSSTTSSVPGGSVTTTTRTSHRPVTPSPPASVSLVETPGTAAAVSTTSTPAPPTTTTSPSEPPPTTTTTVPSTTTTTTRPPPTTTTTSCILGILCN